MALDRFKETLLGELATRIDAEGEAGDRTSLHNLASAFFWRFQPKDMRGRSVDDSLRLPRQSAGIDPPRGPRTVRWCEFSIHRSDSEGWDSQYTSLVVLCQGIPFCTASVRGELNRRNLGIHTFQFQPARPGGRASGELLELLPLDADGSSAEPEGLSVFRNQPTVQAR